MLLNQLVIKSNDYKVCNKIFLCVVRHTATNGFKSQQAIDEMRLGVIKCQHERSSLYQMHLFKTQFISQKHIISR